MPTSTLNPPALNSPGAARELPAPIRATLSGTRTRLRVVDLGLGLARALLVVALGGVGLFALDVALEPPLAVVRNFALFVTMLGLGLCLYLLSKPLRRRLDDDSVALMLEGAFPALHGGLVSAVQLIRDADHYTSQALVDQTVSRAASQVKELEVGRVVQAGALIPLWLLILVFYGGCAAGLSNAEVRSYAGIFVQRVVQGQDVDYPKLVAFEVLLEPEIRIAKGEDFDLKVHVTRGEGLLDELVVMTQLSDKRVETRDLLRKGSEYSKLYQNVTEPFQLRVVAPGHGVRSQVYKVIVVQRPRVERYEFVLRYPAYVGRAPEALSQTALKVPSGTVVSYMAVMNKPLRRADLILERESRGPSGQASFTGQPGPAPTYLGDLPAGALTESGEWAELQETASRLQVGPAEGRRVLLGRFTALEDTNFRFDLLSEEGQKTGPQPVRFSIQVVPDKRPVVTIPVPGGMRQVTPQAKVDLQINAQDDYGLKHLELRLRVIRGQEEEDWKAIELPLPEGSDREAKVAYALALADYRVVGGDRVEYMAVGFDFNTEANRPPGSSRRYTLQIGAPEDLERMFQDRLAALKERLTSAARDQEEARKSSQAFSRELGQKEVMSEEDKRRLKRLESEQRRVTTRLREVKKALEELQAERTANRLTEEGAMNMLSDLQKGVSELSEKASPQIERSLADARQAAQLDPKTRSGLRQVPDRQQDLADELRRLTTRIDKWGDFTEVIQEVRDLLKGEDKVIEGAKRAAAEKNR